MAKELNVEEITVGGIITEPGNFKVNRTGDWRTSRPVVDKEKCNDCGICWLYCPDGAITVEEGKKFAIDYYYCKGCGICAKTCPRKCISMVEEEE